MFKLCSNCLAVATFTDTLVKLLPESFKMAKPVSYTDTAKHDHPTGGGTKQGYKLKKESNKINGNKLKLSKQCQLYQTK